METLAELIFESKEQLTDEQYKNMMNALKEVFDELKKMPSDEDERHERQASLHSMQVRLAQLEESHREREGDMKRILDIQNQSIEEAEARANLPLHSIVITKRREVGGKWECRHIIDTAYYDIPR